jgi:hypothetical protein
VALRVLRARFMTLFHLGVDTNTKICLRRPTDESGAPSPFLRVLPSPQTLSGRRIDGPGDGIGDLRDYPSTEHQEHGAHVAFAFPSGSNS